MENIVYGYFKWDRAETINGCSAEVVIEQHKIKPEQEVYFITRNGMPYMILLDVSAEDCERKIQGLSENIEKHMTMQQLEQENTDNKERINDIENAMAELSILMASTNV